MLIKPPRQLKIRQPRRFIFLLSQKLTYRQTEAGHLISREPAHYAGRWRFFRILHNFYEYRAAPDATILLCGQDKDPDIPFCE